MTKIIGLTGGIATGKSNVSECLSENGYEIIDADKITYELQQKGTNCLNDIVKYFGNHILNDDGSLNRKSLSKIVFSNKSNLTSLMRIMDPYIRFSVNDRINKSTEKTIVLDAPTLFESGYSYMCDKIVVVTCTANNQLLRLIARNGLSIADATKRIANQWPLEFKERLADNLVDSNGSIMQTRSQVVKLFNKISKEIN
ncbi:dephospho-CoA kinase [Apilactobacillus apisilvae]|uniref:Dephospho-CoA kinase n=1 Tax=Apilactobacillus apisilvae TaxID=2923364 RepID=A0ABY4PHH3_9LACO|nr:dephospho-CoA kinase [Apilactobacillus apisilvae]UQS85265.1 dephospho-CoA kinase [Apilactobacillus apisilvae]